MPDEALLGGKPLSAPVTGPVLPFAMDKGAQAILVLLSAGKLAQGKGLPAFVAPDGGVLADALWLVFGGGGCKKIEIETETEVKSFELNRPRLTFSSCCCPAAASVSGI